MDRLIALQPSTGFARAAGTLTRPPLCPVMARPVPVPLELTGRRVLLRTLSEADYDDWREVRSRCRDWLVPWEPRPKGAPLPAEDRASFAARCALRERERQLGTGYGFGIFVEGRFAGEITLSSIQRGPFQTGHIGYWIDRDLAGHGYVPEAVVVVLSFAFDTIALHRVEISIIPRNHASLRVVEKLGLRSEGIAQKYLEIDGEWEDHAKFAITLEEWKRRRDELLERWIR
ncbi:MAG: GNAT family protein [Actinomycetota bacterium]|jgi:ribosomal-protein-alanine N-acetyltransferase|nr:GNAT family protein [Actinomycetota bacterium]